MCSPQEEQEMEIEALKIIFESEFQDIETSKFSITISSDSEDEDSRVVIKFIVTYTDRYPEEVPFLELEDIQNISSKEIKEIHKELIHQATENIGVAMIYNMACLLKEKINNLNDSTASPSLSNSSQSSGLSNIQKKPGTPVTREEFLKWRSKFESELLEKKQVALAEAQVQAIQMGEKVFLTGRQIFEQNLSNIDETEEEMTAEDIEGGDLTEEEQEQEQEEIGLDDEINNEDDYKLFLGGL